MKKQRFSSSFSFSKTSNNFCHLIKSQNLLKSTEFPKKFKASNSGFNSCFNKSKFHSTSLNSHNYQEIKEKKFNVFSPLYKNKKRKKNKQKYDYYHPQQFMNNKLDSKLYYPTQISINLKKGKRKMKKPYCLSHERYFHNKESFQQIIKSCEYFSDSHSINKTTISNSSDQYCLFNKTSK